MLKNKYFIISIIVLISILLFSMMLKEEKIKVGDKIPMFNLKDQYGKDFFSKDYVGKTAMVIYFYPKDDTPGCTKEACKFRDTHEEFKKLNVKIIGISGDDVESHLNFANTYGLPFTLLADTNNTVRKLFGVPGSVLGLIPGRVTYVVDNRGVVTYIYNSMTNAENHIKEALKAIQN